ncbi:restriction endonuclease [Glutamicibacter arilaitensis]|nr:MULTISPECIES: restriction endonuclease [Glutamicibacter]HCJ53495.1 restriction endonuclease [Glutamicibacter sp.]
MKVTVAEIPKWHGFLTPVLRALADGRSRARADLIEAALDIAEVDEEQRKVRIRSGGSQAKGRVGWAISHLIAAQALERPEGALYKITVEGVALLDRHPERMAQAELREVPAYRAHQKAIKAARRDGATVVAPEAVDDTEEDPQDMIDAAIDRIEAEAGATLLARLRESHPDFFEEAVVKLLLGMGYGGAEQRGRRIGGSGDGGVDGVIDQDALGLEQIYVQAKRYAESNRIGRETIQAFIGALHGFGASRGVFITTSTFTQHAREYAASIPTRIVLIDGKRLVSLMIKYRVGVQVKQSYDVVDIDEDFFE